MATENEAAIESYLGYGRDSLSRKSGEAHNSLISSFAERDGGLQKQAGSGGGDRQRKTSLELLDRWNLGPSVLQQEPWVSSVADDQSTATESRQRRLSRSLLLWVGVVPLGGSMVATSHFSFFIFIDLTIHKTFFTSILGE
jgi:hypothetical protein